jgi:outer membrane protein
MMLRSMALIACVLGTTLAGDARGQEPSTHDENGAAVTGGGVSDTHPAAPPASDVQLIDRSPNHIDVLEDQWSPELPADVHAAEQSAAGYGWLVDTAATEIVSLQQCVALALKYNTELQIQRLGPVSAAVGVRQARAIFDPALFGNLDKNRSVIPAESLSAFTSGSVTTTSLFDQNFNANVGLRKLLLSGGQVQLFWQNNRNRANPSVVNLLDPQYNVNLGLSLNQPLLRDFGWRYTLLRVEVAQNTEEASYERYRASIADIITRVEQVYWRLVLALQSVTVQEQGLALARETQRQNEGKFNVGALPQTAVLEARTEVARREALLIEVQNAAENARDTLRAIINAKDPAAMALLRIDPAEKPTVVPYTIDLERSLKTALEERPELLAARLDIRGAGLQRKIAENQLLPRLNFVGGIGLNSISGTGQPPFALPQPGATPTPFAVANPALIGGYGHALGLLPDGRYYNYSAGVVVEVPLDNAAAKADYAQADVAFEQSRLSLRQLEESVTLEIKQAVNNLVTDLKSVDARRLARELEEENLRNQQARYDVGLATTKDLLDFQDRLTQARFLEIQALTQYNTDLAQMRRVDGSLLNARNVYIERPSPEPAPWWASF